MTDQSNFEVETSAERPRDASDGRAHADVPSLTRNERIARRAYEIFESRGGDNGRALEDWLQAEHDVDD